MSLVFDENGMDMSIVEEEKGEKEYPFYGMSLSYAEGEDVVTAAVLTRDGIPAERLLQPTSWHA